MPRPHRTAPLLITALLLAGPVPAAMSQSAPPAAVDADPVAPAGFTGPREAFDAAKAAFNERHWDGFLACVTPDQQAVMVGEMVAAFEMMRQRPGADARVADLMNRFFPRGIPADALSADPAARRAATAPLVAGLDQPAVFFGEATDLAMSLEHGARSSEVTVDALGDLRPVKTADGASNRAVRAEVTLLLPEADAPRRDVWTFVVIDKRWYLAPLGAG